MSLWLATSPQSEVSSDLRFRISWEPAGFGIWRMRVTSGDDLIANIVKGGFEEARTAARYCCKAGEA